jgi:hypothetical protein
MSLSSDRASPAPLNGQTDLSGDVFIFASSLGETGRLC